MGNVTVQEWVVLLNPKVFSVVATTQDLGGSRPSANNSLAALRRVSLSLSRNILYVG